MLNYLINCAKLKLAGQKGQGMVEYALLLVFAVAVAAAVFSTDASTGLGGAISGAIDSVSKALGVSDAE